MIQSPAHIFATARGKDKWTTEDKNGRMSPKKVGEGSVASDDTEYNYTCTFNISQDTHVASCSKDNTHIFENRFDVLTEKDGEKLYNWANTGAEQPKEEKKTFKEMQENSKKTEDVKKVTNEDVLNVFKKKVESGKDKNALYAIVEGICGSKNFMTVKEPDVLANIYDAIKNA